MSLDPTSLSLVHPLARADVAVERHDYLPGLAFELYRPASTSPAPAVVFVSGLPDPGVVQLFGKPLKDWASYQGWARLVAASGLAAITYANRTPDDVGALVHHLRAHAGALRLDPDRLAVWACSGNAPTALALLARERLAAAALLYGYLLDLDGSTIVADAARRMYFAAPPVALADLPRVPILVVRADRDTTPGLNETIDRFVARAELPLTLRTHDGPHAFDLLDDTDATRAVIDEVVAFLGRALG
jgi:acetyl esterase/lipase